MARVLVLGGGFGGVATSLKLRELLSDNDEIIMVDRRTHFAVGFRKTWALLDIKPLEEGQRELATLNQRGITVRQATVDEILPESCAAVIDGETISADAMVVALGVRHAVEKIPGFTEHALNAYALRDLESTKQKLRAFKGGKVIMGIFGLPYQCPPAPYEMAILTKEYFTRRGINADISVISPNPMSLSDPDSAERLQARMAEFDLEFLPNHKVTSVEAGVVVTDQGRLDAYLIMGVPPHIAVDVVRNSPLVEASGWIHPDRYTLETAFDNVYAIGDCTHIPVGPKGALPKAGLFAEKEGIVVAQRIASRLAGQVPTAVLDGNAACYVETGRGEAGVISGDFYADPKPDVKLSALNVDYYAEKDEFESSRLEKWFDTVK